MCSVKVCLGRGVHGWEFQCSSSGARVPVEVERSGPFGPCSREGEQLDEEGGA